MTNHLPPNPSLDHLKQQARHLQSDHLAGTAGASERVEERLPGFEGRRLSLAKAQTVIAREYGFSSWPKLKALVEVNRPRGVIAEALTDEQAAFIRAILIDDVETARVLLGRQPELANVRIAGGLELQGDVPENRDDRRSGAPLHNAAFRGQEELIAVLLDAGAEVDALGYVDNDRFCTPLSIAAWEGTLGCMRLLLDAGADPDAIASDGVSHVTTAIGHSQPDKVELLMNYGATLNLHDAIAMGMVDFVRARLQQEPGLATVLGDSDRLPMSVAAGSGQREVAEILIRFGANVKMIQACGLGMLDYVKSMLKEAPNSVNQVEGKETPLIAASRSGHGDVVAYLLDHGADVDLVVREGVHNIQAIDVAKSNVIDLLATAGADVCHVYRGFTPLMRALAEGWPHGKDDAAVKALVKRGGLGRFYIVGQWIGHLERLESLIELGVDVNETDKDGKTALDHAMKNRDATDAPGDLKQHTHLIELLQQHGGRHGDTV